MAELSGGDSYLILDDLYHVKQADQVRVLDYFHRLAKGNNLWLKIGTIRHRTKWYVHGDPPIGVKIGDDADEIDLDLTLERFSQAKRFLAQILRAFLDECGGISIDELLVDDAMTRLVLASGGVARDFLGIFRRSIDIARERGEDRRGDKVGVEDVNGAAGEYDLSKREELKRDTLDERTNLEEALERIRNFCLNKINSNIFLLEKDTPGASEIDELVDLRLLHKVKSHVTAWGRQGKLYEAYMLDISQYTGSRSKRNLAWIEFWKQSGNGGESESEGSVTTQRTRHDDIRRASLIYIPLMDYSSTAEGGNASRKQPKPKPGFEQGTLLDG